MKTIIKGLAGIGLMGALAGMASGAALAEEDKDAAPGYFMISDTEIQILWGNNFDLRSGAPDETSVLTLTLEHFSTWKYGDNFFFTDLSFDLDGNGNNNAETTIYTEFYPSLSFSKITGESISIGPLIDVNATAGINVDADGFLALLPGARLDFKVPGFNFVGLAGYVYETVRDPFDRNLDTTYQATLTWQAPIVISERVKLVFQGFADVIGDRGQGVKTQFLTQPQLRLDVGALLGVQENKYYIGTEVSYWANKFGTDTDEFAPQVIGVFKF